MRRVLAPMDTRGRACHVQRVKLRRAGELPRVLEFSAEKDGDDPRLNVPSFSFFPQLTFSSAADEESGNFSLL